MRQESILVVDGDITLSERLKTRLEAMDYIVNCACCANEALSILNTKWIDLVILAVVLQDGMDGLQLFKEIKGKKEFSKLPIAIHSKKPAMRETFMAMGAASFFTKPYSMDVFLGEIKDILTKKVLILGDEGNVLQSIHDSLSEYDVRIDILHNPYKFYVNIAAYRYSLVVIQSKVKTTTADMSAEIVRQSQKNKNVPIIVYPLKKAIDMDEKDKAGIQTFKSKFQKRKFCEFMENGYSTKQFLELAKNYLEHV